jgi:DNA-binding MltR family transcriptional regulator
MAKKPKEVIKGLHDDRLLKELDGASPRATVIVGASAVERMLEQLLEKFLVGNKAFKESFLSGNNAPLGTFSAKIKAAYALGLVSIKTYQDMERVRAIRNKFAHDLFDCNFENKEIINLVRSFNYGPTMFKSSNGEPIETRLLFILELQVIVFSIIRKTTRLAQIKEINANDDDWGLEQMDYDWMHSR